MSVMRDLYSNLDAAQSIAPAARTVTVNGAEVDILNYDSALAVLDLGAYTDGDWSFKLQHRELTTDAWADVPAAMQVGEFESVASAAGQNKTQRVGYIGDLCRLRLVGTEAGGSPAASTGLVFGGVILRGNPRMAPLA